MNEASRMEKAIQAAEAEDFDLTRVVRGCAESYRGIAGNRQVHLMAPESPIRFHGAPDLIAQALDKLFDNAKGFTPEGGWIRLKLALDPEGVETSVANSGPPLPAKMQERLFDSLVSMRDAGSLRAAGEVPHLGLGLYRAPEHRRARWQSTRRQPRRRRRRRVPPAAQGHAALITGSPHTALILTSSALWGDFILVNKFDYLSGKLDPEGQQIILPFDAPIKKDSHLVVLKGNLSPTGAVAKITGKEGLYFEGPARVFEGEIGAMRGILDGEVQAGEVVVIENAERLGLSQLHQLRGPCRSRCQG